MGVPYDGDTATALLGRAPGVFRAMLLDLPPGWLDAREGPDGWSPREVACHVADLERDGWLPRLQVILEHGPDAMLPGIERERFRSTYEGASIREVLDDFDRLRRANLGALAALQLGQEQVSARGRHSVFGEVRASELLSTWVVHDLTHQAQIARVLAARYREAVGPWREYLGVLRPRA